MSEQQTYWCHECDISIHLLLTIDSPSSPPPLCPDCHTCNLELMDDPTLTDTASFFLDAFFLPFFSGVNPSEESGRSAVFDDSVLPTIKISGGDDSCSVIVCGVCKDEFVVDVDEAKVLPCNHLFHPDCILPWLHSDHLSCPLCRFHLLPVPSSSSSAVDCSSTDVGALSNFLPSQF
ncbi:uncharacterized protein LOC126667611 [Mercurialis annua]|uniref:uncharacterized protein LOC126667611 n=1 Tax=Mercurialis annua TaxID=3986 RepID=UPI00215FC3B2|nr:uncharacterized protein LOC126667611 [Mercurialis annua]